MVSKVSQFAAEMADREAIRDCLYRYSRGIDRADGDMLLSAYWPGAMDYHTGFAGTAEEFVEWALPRLRTMEEQMHLIANILIRIDGDIARAESYFWSVVVPEGGDRQTLAVGRYLDRFEKRDDEWRIAERWVAHDWFNEDGRPGDWSVGPFGMTGLLRGAPRPDDKSYGWLGLE